MSDEGVGMTQCRIIQTAKLQYAYLTVCISMHVKNLKASKTTVIHRQSILLEYIKFGF